MSRDRRWSTPDEEREAERNRRKRQRARNREYRIVSVFFAVIFLSLAGYLIYYEAVLREDFINSPYNTRQDTFADQVIRGQIQASNGEVLAQTLFDWDGSEYRNYPYGRIFSHVVGYDSHGKNGLESEANFQLLTSHQFFLDQIKNQMQGSKNTGDSIRTSLDVNLQNAAYYALGDYRGAVIAMEPSTGRILAMVSKPDYDPNTIASDWEYMINEEGNSSLLNRATQGGYPPGSTFKIITALDYYRTYGTVDGFRFDCEGSISRDDYTLTCYDSHVHGSEDLWDAFAYSCNSAFANMGLQLGAVSLRSTAESLLFNKKLPLSMEYNRSRFPLKANAEKPEIMQTSIGQGDTLVSPMHMAMITSAIANDGVMMKPTLIDGIVNATGDRVASYRSVEYKQLLTSQEAETLKELMKGVVDYGTATSLSGRGYTVAGKTGTAEIDSDGNSHSWFVGFSNVEDPDLVVSVVIEYGGTGNEYAVPVAAQIFDAYHNTWY